jgi:hypothetical protein
VQVDYLTFEIFVQCCGLAFRQNNLVEEGVQLLLEVVVFLAVDFKSLKQKLLKT